MKTIIISSFDEYLQYTEKYKGRYYFRGQSNAAWNITPSLFRGNKVATFESERKVIQAQTEQNQHLTPLSALFKAQHYGIPTRICDLTISHLCALFFAAEGTSDGAVYVFDKKHTSRIESPEMTMFERILKYGITAMSDLDDYEHGEVSDVLMENYIVEYQDFAYSNSRAFRQGGTGIVFGFSCVSDKIIPVGTRTVDNLIVEKIVIPTTVKAEISKKLRQLGYSKEILHGDIEAHKIYEEIELFQTDFSVEQRSDKGIPFNKINAKYRVSSLYFDQDELALKISRLYKKLFLQYGANARIWTYFFFDDNDLTHTNWICMGWWNSNTQYEINWTKSYEEYRLYYMNEEISRDDAIKQFEILLQKITPIYFEVLNLISKPEYNLAELFSLVERVQSDVRQICHEANNISFSDVETEKTTRLAWMYINNIDWLVGDMSIFSKRSDLKEQTVKWMLEHTYIKKCEESKQAVQQAFVQKDGDAI